MEEETLKNSYLNNLRSKYPELINDNDSGYWIISLKLDDVEYIFRTDITELIYKFPKTVLLQPNIQFDGISPIIFGGVVVFENLTDITWNLEDGLDFVADVIDVAKILHENRKFKEPVILQEVIKENYTRITGFEERIVRLKYKVVETEDIVLNCEIKALIGTEYIGMQNKNGLKMLSKIDKKSHDENIVYISKEQQENLLLGEDDFIDLIFLENVPTNNVEIRLFEEILYYLPNIEEKLSEVLAERNCLTEGTVIRFFDKEYKKERRIYIFKLDFPYSTLEKFQLKILPVIKRKTQKFIDYSVITGLFR